MNKKWGAGQIQTLDNTLILDTEKSMFISLSRFGIGNVNGQAFYCWTPALRRH